MSRRRKVVLTIIPALLLLGVLLLAACDQEAALPSGGNNQSGDNGNPASPSPINPPPVWEGDPWSNPEDYEYYYQQEITENTDHVKYQDHKTQAVDLLKLLRDEIVPQSVDLLLKRFPKTFGYLEEWCIGMNVDLNNNLDASRAAVSMDHPKTEGDKDKPVESRYWLKISFDPEWWGEGKGLGDHWKNQLEADVVHEMMHAFMFETLTCGFSGYTACVLKQADPFPKWFQEGIAEAVCGAAGSVRMSNGLGITGDSTVKEITKKLNIKKLTGETTASQYYVGYLAVMYLGYLANGRTSVNAEAIAKGLDTLMFAIQSGSSLDQAIANNSSNQFTGLTDFEENFASRGAPFIKELMQAIGESGRGALITGDYSATDLLNSKSGIVMRPLFWLYLGNGQYSNDYNDTLKGPDVFEGGSATMSGVPSRFNIRKDD